MSVLSLQRERKPQNGLIDVARRWLDEFGRVTLATVVSTWGSSPVPVGGQLVVAPGERFEGSVSGGCVEVDVISEAGDVMETGRSKLLEFGVADETAWRSGLPCGGTMKVFLERLEMRFWRQGVRGPRWLWSQTSVQLPVGYSTPHPQCPPSLLKA